MHLRAPGELYLRWYPLVESEASYTRRLYRLTLDWADIMAYAFVGLLEALPLASGDDRRVQTYLRIRVRGAIIDGVRKESLEPRRAYEKRREARQPLLRFSCLTVVDHTPDPEALAIAREEERLVKQAFCSLTQRERAMVVALFDLKDKGDSGAAYAYRVGLNPSTLYYHRERLARRLSKKLGALHG